MTMMNITSKDVDHSRRGISAKDMRYFNQAVKVAGNSQCRYSHGSIIRRGKTVVASACNVIKTHPVQQRYSSHVCSIHAEAAAVIKAKSNTIGTVCYSVRIRPDGTLAISKPCPSCRSVLIDAGIRDVVYFDGNFIVKERITH